MEFERDVWWRDGCLLGVSVFVCVFCFCWCFYFLLEYLLDVFIWFGYIGSLFDRVWMEVVLGRFGSFWCISCIGWSWCWNLGSRVFGIVVVRVFWWCWFCRWGLLKSG